ncbi:MAG: NAD(P)H-quinone oxidoreductase, partial [Clostridia bacterium]|nr:NAD(P)H-quinone oxidoreductase [Clostridia bacterium]
MKAILIQNDENRSLIWADVPDPVCGEDDCVVKIEACGVNRADLLQRAGDYPPPPGCPEWMGLEIAGTITEMGGGAKAKSRWKIGDRVCALLGGGGYAEYANVKYDMLMPVPDGCSMTDAAAIPEAFATAYLNLFYEGRAEAGETLLMNAGASGLASVIIPMAKAFGMRVITTVRKAHQVDAIAHLGADRVVNTSCEDIAAVLKEELDAGHGVDLAIDCLGGEIMGKCLPHLNRGARWIMIAALAGTLTEVDLKNIYVKGIRIIGSTLRSRKPEVKAALLAELTEKVFPKITSGEIRPTVGAAFPITEAEDAQKMMADGRQVG